MLNEMELILFLHNFLLVYLLTCNNKGFLTQKSLIKITDLCNLGITEGWNFIAPSYDRMMVRLKESRCVVLTTLNTSLNRIGNQYI